MYVQSTVGILVTVNNAVSVLTSAFHFSSKISSFCKFDIAKGVFSAYLNCSLLSCFQQVAKMLSFKCDGIEWFLRIMAGEQVGKLAFIA